MIVTDKFIFVHMHKCGGTFINVFLKKFFPQAREVGYHFPLKQVPPEFRHLPVLGTVRNPWDFYVSYFEFQKTVMQRVRAVQAIEQSAMLARGEDPLNGLDAIYEFVTAEGALDFHASLRRAMNLGGPQGLLEQALPRMPQAYGHRGPSGTPVQSEGFRGMNLLAGELAEIAGTGWGFYSFLFRRMYGDDPVHILKTDDLRGGLREFLDRQGLLTRAMDAHLGSAPRENTSEHQAYPRYYDPALRQLVQEKDAWLIDRYGFIFEPSVPALEPA